MTPTDVQITGSISLVFTKFGTVVAPKRYMFPIEFKAMWSKVKVKLLICLLLTLCLMAIKLAKLIGLFGHTVMIKLLVFISALSAQYFMNHLLYNYHPNLIQWLPLESGIFIVYTCMQNSWILHQGGIDVSQTFLVFVITPHLIG